METKNPSTYELQDGKKKGKSVAHLMFLDWDWLRYMYRDRISKNKSPSSKKNDLEIGILHCFEVDKNLPIKKICPHCNNKPVKFFSIKGSRGDGYSMGGEYMSCEDECCINELLAIHRGQIFEIHFSFLRKIKYKFDRKQYIKNVLKVALGIENKRLTRKLAEDIFK